MGRNADMVRASMEAFNDGSLAEQLERFYDPAVAVFEEPELPDGRAWHGHEGMRGYLAEIDTRWSEIRLQASELIEVDDTVVVVGLQHARGRHSGTMLSAPHAAVFDLRDGKVTRIRVYGSPKQALAAAGLTGER